jgi:dipeptidyl aminopeptidase/acylaminoacyl peptidase
MMLGGDAPVNSLLSGYPVAVVRKVVLAVAALLVAIAVGSPFALAWYASEQFLRPAWYEHRTPEQGLRPGKWTDPRADFGLAFEDVEFSSVDGSTLRGWLVAGSAATRTAIVTVHGGSGDRRSYMGLLPALHGAGYPVLLFDCREQGVSDGDGRGMSVGMRESADVVSAVDFLEARGFGTIAALGGSQGASSAILATAVDERIGAVVAQGTGTTLYEMMRANAQLTPFPDWWVRLFARTVVWRTGPPWHEIVADGPNPGDAIARISPRAVFLIQGSEDDMAPAEQARENYRRAGEPKRLWIVEGAGHRGLRGFASDEYDRRVVGFLRAYAPL